MSILSTTCREMNMRNSGIDAIFPIWLAGTHKTTKQLASEMMSAGLKAVLTCVDPKRMPKELVGRFWDQNLLQVICAGRVMCMHSLWTR